MCAAHYFISFGRGPIKYIFNHFQLKKFLNLISYSSGKRRTVGGRTQQLRGFDKIPDSLPPQLPNVSLVGVLRAVKYVPSQPAEDWAFAQILFQRLIILRACSALHQIHISNFADVGTYGQVACDDPYNVTKLPFSEKQELFDLWVMAIINNTSK